MKENNELFTTMPVGKAVARLAIPTVVSQIIVILYSMADTFSLVKRATRTSWQRCQLHSRFLHCSPPSPTCLVSAQTA